MGMLRFLIGLGRNSPDLLPHLLTFMERHGLDEVTRTIEVPGYALELSLRSKKDNWHDLRFRVFLRDFIMNPEETPRPAKSRKKRAFGGPARALQNGTSFSAFPTKWEARRSPAHSLVEKPRMLHHQTREARLHHQVGTIATYVLRAEITP